MKNLNPIIVILSLMYGFTCLLVHDANIYIAGVNSGISPNIFGLIIGGLVILGLLKSLKDNDSSTTLGMSALLLFVTVINIIFILIDFTANSSSIISNDVQSFRAVAGFAILNILNSAIAFTIIVPLMYKTNNILTISFLALIPLLIQYQPEQLRTRKLVSATRLDRPSFPQGQVPSDLVRPQ
jgi:hypothetical protein